MTETIEAPEKYGNKRQNQRIYACVCLTNMGLQGNRGWSAWNKRPAVRNGGKHTFHSKLPHVRNRFTVLVLLNFLLSSRGGSPESSTPTEHLPDQGDARQFDWCMCGGGFGRFLHRDMQRQVSTSKPLSRCGFFGSIDSLVAETLLGRFQGCSYDLRCFVVGLEIFVICHLYCA
jgi:hypothetical protein